MDNQEINDALDMAVEVAISDTYDEMLGRPMQACINLNRSLELNRKARQHFEQVIVLEPLEDLCVDEPELLQHANANPVSLAFMIEAMMMMGLFLVYIWFSTRSVMQVVLFLALTFVGSLAFSFAVFVYANSKGADEKTIGA